MWLGLEMSASWDWKCQSWLGLDILKLVGFGNVKACRDWDWECQSSWFGLRMAKLVVIGTSQLWNIVGVIVRCCCLLVQWVPVNLRLLKLLCALSDGPCGLCHFVGHPFGWCLNCPPWCTVGLVHKDLWTASKSGMIVISVPSLVLFPPPEARLKQLFASIHYDACARIWFELFTFLLRCSLCWQACDLFALH